MQVYGSMTLVFDVPSPKNPCEYPHIPYLIFLATTIISLHYAADNIGLSSFLVGSVKLSHFCKSDVSAVQGHPRSLILVPIESAYATSC